MRHISPYKTFEAEETLDLPQGWDGSDRYIFREFEFKDFLTAMGFLNGVGEIANRMDHHPKMTIDFNRVLVGTSTHDVGRVTHKDLELASAANALYHP
jgi:4a-hydroxytetrahydrobiopterin dehydratase